MMKRAKSLERRREEAIEEKKTLLRDVEEVSALKMNLLPFHKERMIQLEKLSLALGAKKLFTEFSMEICRGERIALEGRKWLREINTVETDYGCRLRVSGEIICGGRAENFLYISRYFFPFWQPEGLCQSPRLARNDIDDCSAPAGFSKGAF